MTELDWVNIATAKLQAEDAWHSGQASYLPLSAAAAITFHQVHRNTKAIVTRDDYDDALNIAASALSRLIPILTLRSAKEGRTELSIDPVSQRFARGATELHGSDGAIVRNLSVRTAQFGGALLRLKHSGVLGASFALTAHAERARRTGRQLDPAAPAPGLAAELILDGQRERRRISALLHEQLAQVVVGCRMQLDALAERLEGEPRARVAGVAESLKLAYETAVALAVELEPPALAEFGLVRALGSLAREQAQLHGLKVSVQAHAEEELQDPETCAFLFDATRLLLANVARHAHVRGAAVRLRVRYGMLELTVSDGGAGFDARSVPWRLRPCSLRRLEQCARALGGSLSILTRPGGGTRVKLRIPKVLEDERQPVDSTGALPGSD